MVYYQLLDLYIHFCFINVSFVQSLFVTNEKKKEEEEEEEEEQFPCLHITAQGALSLSLSLIWSVLDSSYMDACVENYFMYLTYILSLYLSLSLSHGVCSNHHVWMHALRIILYSCHTYYLSHITHGYMSITHI